MRTEKLENLSYRLLPTEDEWREIRATFRMPCSGSGGCQVLVKTGSYAVTTLVQYARLCHFDQFSGIAGALNSIGVEFDHEKQGPGCRQEVALTRLRIVCAILCVPSDLAPAADQEVELTRESDFRALRGIPEQCQ